jgi:hypothetical protein
MAAMRMLAGVELRRRWRHVVVLTLLVGFSAAVVLVVLNLVTAVPARAAARTRPAVVLRSE